MPGFQIESLTAVVEALQTQAVVIITPPQESAWGRRCVIQDPDGRDVELSEKPILAV
jgi:lactoylglutathione lyase